MTIKKTHKGEEEVVVGGIVVCIDGECDDQAYGGHCRQENYPWPVGGLKEYEK